MVVFATRYIQYTFLVYCQINHNNMTSLTPQTGLIILLSFGLIMTLSSLLFRKREGSVKEFLVANREIGWLPGAFSIAASWIWAPALFISVQVSYQMGLAGLFWFTAPNVLALVLFAFFAPRIREALPDGVTLPQFIGERFKSSRLKKLYLFPTLFYQLMAVTIQIFAGGSLVSLLTGLPLNAVMPLLLVIALIYTMISGIKASIITDVVQLGMIFGLGVIIIPMVWNAGGGFEAIKAGLAGTQGVASIFDPGVAFSFGIVTAIGLIAGALTDQQYWQRSFAIRKQSLRPAFVLGGLLFAIVPVTMSILGFIAVSKGFVVPQGADISMIGVQTVSELLPSWAVLLFFIMLLSGLSSTLDSGLSAMSSLWATDIYPKGGLLSARLSMVIIGVAGWLVAIAVNSIPEFGLQHLWWIFNTIAACVAGPTILSLYSKRVNEKGMFWGILIAFVGGVPLFVYSNIQGNSIWIVASALFVVVVSSTLSIIKYNKTTSI